MSQHKLQVDGRMDLQYRAAFVWHLLLAFDSVEVCTLYSAVVQSWRLRQRGRQRAGGRERAEAKKVLHHNSRGVAVAEAVAVVDVLLVLHHS